MSTDTPAQPTEKWCLFCDKDTHRTTECHSTVALNTPAQRELFRLAAASPQPAQEPVRVATAEESVALDAKLGLVLLPPIRVPVRTHALLTRIAEVRGLVVQAVVRELLETGETMGAAQASGELVEALRALLDEQDAQQGYATPAAYDRARAALSRAPGAGMHNVAIEPRR